MLCAGGVAAPVALLRNKGDILSRERMPPFFLDLCGALLWGDRIFEKCGIGRDERGDGGKTLEIRGKRRLSARDGGANYQQS